MSKKKFKTKNYKEAKLNHLGKQDEVIKKLSKIEQAILTKHVLVKIVGKKGPFVSLLLTQQVEEALDMCLAYREHNSIHLDIDYFFYYKDRNQN